MTEQNTTTSRNGYNSSNSKPIDKYSCSFKLSSIIVLVYLGIGATLSLPYTWITDGSNYVMIFYTLALPALFLAIFFTGLVASIENNKKTMSKFIDVELIFLLFFLLLPVLLKYLAKIINIIGNTTLAHSIYNHRFFSPIDILIIYILYHFGKKLLIKD